MVIGFRKLAPALDPLEIEEERVELVHQYKYLGTTLYTKLDWAENSVTLLRKANQRFILFVFWEETGVLQG